MKAPRASTTSREFRVLVGYAPYCVDSQSVCQRGCRFSGCRFDCWSESQSATRLGGARLQITNVGRRGLTLCGRSCRQTGTSHRPRMQNKGAWPGLLRERSTGPRATRSMSRGCPRVSDHARLAFNSCAAELRISRDSFSSFTARAMETAPTSVASAVIAFDRLVFRLGASMSWTSRSR